MLNTLCPLLNYSAVGGKVCNPELYPISSKKSIVFLILILFDIAV